MRKTKWESPKLIALGTDDPAAGICQMGSANPTGTCKDGVQASGAACSEGGAAQGSCNAGDQANAACKGGQVAEPAQCKGGGNTGVWG
jgi:hypothetical protein